MNEPFDQQEARPDEEAVEIYSRTAIRWFAILFSPLFGGIMLTLNLRNAGYRQAANQVLLLSAAYTLFIIVLQNLFKQPSSLFTILFSVMGASVLADYYFPKYFPDNDYYPKSIVWALIIGLGLSALFIASILLNPAAIKAMK